MLGVDLSFDGASFILAAAPPWRISDRTAPTRKSGIRAASEMASCREKCHMETQAEAESALHKDHKTLITAKVAPVRRAKGTKLLRLHCTLPRARLRPYLVS